MDRIPDLAAIEQAAQRIKPHVHHTPVLTSQTINRRLGAEIYFKCENLQKAGAFKARGAMNAVYSLDEAQAAKGVVTHSSGNHAGALALAAQKRGIPANIVMPNNSPLVKQAAVKGYGATVHLCEPTQAAREAMANQLLESTGGVLIHPYNNYFVMAGAGTAAMELIEDSPPLDYIISPVGGGGLISGTAIATAGLSPQTKVVGVEPAEADFGRRSLAEGRMLPQDHSPKTVADGLMTAPGELTFEVMSDKLDRILAVPDEQTLEALSFVLERMKIVIEPSSAVPLAALFSGQLDVSGKKVGLILSGGNLDLSKLSGWYDQAK
jgi:threonine dehydratase